MKYKLLLVTFPIDYGSQTFEKRYIKFFENHVDLKTYRFVPDQFVPRQKNLIPLLRTSANIIGRFLGSFRLQKKVLEAYREGRSIVFQGVSPALFAYPVVKRDTCFILTDWTRKLYETIDGKSMSPPWLTFIHKQVLASQRSIIGLTDAVLAEIAEDYGIPCSKLVKGRLPFSVDLDLFVPSPARNDGKVKILFVGGDLRRKGGDILLDWFLKQDNHNLQLTMVTSQCCIDHERVEVVTNVRYGEDDHIKLFETHDIFVLPTKRDAYPSVIGEAACSGLAVLTTKSALGAPEVIRNGVNGYIFSSQEDLVKGLSVLVRDNALIQEMKQNSRQLMEERFAEDSIAKEFHRHIFES